MTTTTRSSECNAPAPRLLMALELGRRQWMIGFTTTPGAPVRQRTLGANEWQRLPAEIAAAKARFGLPPDAPVESCYEAGPDGFWVHRYLTQIGVTNRVVDSSSIEVNRRARRAKTDKLDVRKLGTMLYRVLQGEAGVWREVRVPSGSDEDGRQPHRELRALKRYLPQRGEAQLPWLFLTERGDQFTRFAINYLVRITGERKTETEEKNKKYHRIERCYGTFLRAFTLPDGADGTKFNADYKDGVLTVHLPKTETAKPKAVEVKVV